MSSAPPAHDTPGQRTVALSKDLTVRVLDQGTGPVVLLLHGNPDNADEWLPLTGFLRDNFRCIAPDLPGYGRRNATHELPDGFDYSLRAQTDFVSELLTALGIDGKITLVVHDIGGIMGVPGPPRIRLGCVRCCTPTPLPFPTSDGLDWRGSLGREARGGAFGPPETWG